MPSCIAWINPRHVKTAPVDMGVCLPVCVCVCLSVTVNRKDNGNFCAFQLNRSVQFDCGVKADLQMNVPPLYPHIAGGGSDSLPELNLM